MRTTVNLDPKALAIVKSRANREQKTLGEILNQLIFASTEGSPYKAKQGFPVLKVKEHGRVLTSEEVREMMDDEDI